MKLGVLALIGLCSLAGPLIAAAGRVAVPVVVGELLAGIVIGKTGFGLVHPGDPTLSLLSDVGFAMLMLSVGMQVPLRDARLAAALGRGASAAALVALLAVPGGLLAATLGVSSHTAIYAVVLASGSAAIVLPVLEERGLSSPAALTIIAQVTVADIAATLAVAFVLRPGRAAHAALGSLAVAGAILVLAFLARQVRRTRWLVRLRADSKHQAWALDLRVALIVLFGLAWIAQRSGASILVAGFGTGLLVAALGGPKRLSTQVLGAAQGFFVPLFFVLLGARLDLRALVSDSRLLQLTACLLALNVAIHLAAGLATRQPPGAALIATAQLGVPAAVVSLGLMEHVLRPGEGAAIIVAALATLACCAAGAALLATGEHGGSVAASGGRSRSRTPDR